MRIRFLSRNEHKIEEARVILSAVGITVVPVHFAIDEPQSADTTQIVRMKTLQAFHRVGYPIFVEQTGLEIDRLAGFPGGLTQVFWDTLKEDRVADLFGRGEDTGVTARTRIGYCDGRQIEQFEGHVRGRFAPEPRGPRHFQWDCVFIPDGETQTFAEMGADRKNSISMRRRALDAFAKRLGEKLR